MEQQAGRTGSDPRRDYNARVAVTNLEISLSNATWGARFDPAAIGKQLIHIHHHTLAFWSTLGILADFQDVAYPSLEWAVSHLMDKGPAYDEAASDLLAVQALCAMAIGELDDADNLLAQAATLVDRKKGTTAMQIALAFHGMDAERALRWFRELSRSYRLALEGLIRSPHLPKPSFMPKPRNA